MIVKLNPCEPLPKWAGRIDYAVLIEWTYHPDWWWPIHEWLCDNVQYRADWVEDVFLRSVYVHFRHEQDYLNFYIFWQGRHIDPAA